MKKLLKNLSGIAMALALCAVLIACNGAQNNSADTTNASTVADSVTDAATEADATTEASTEADATTEAATEDVTVEESTPAVSEDATTTAPDTTPSEFDGVQEIYVSGTTVTTGITVGGTIKSCTLNGEDILANITAEKGAKLTLNEDAVAALKYGENILSYADEGGASYKIILYSGVSEDEIVYLDFDINSYTNDDRAAVPSTIEENGIDGKSLHLTKGSDGGNLFGFFKNGDNGFPAFTFVAGTEYKLSFDMKVLDGTADAWWCPIRFGDNGDVIFIYPNGTWKTNDNNILYSQATIMENEDGSYRVTAIFKATDKTVNLDIPNWGGAVDILIDNMCIEKLDENITRIGCVGDSITESTNPEISYPEWLQMMLGYDNYYVFNFGKSASNVLAEGALPYRTWAKWQYDYLQLWNPDVIFTMLGTNDGRPDSGISVYMDKAFINDYTSYINEFRELADEVYMVISPYAFGNEYGINASLVNDHIVNVEGYIAYLEELPVIDVHAAIKGLDRATYFPDYIHGNNAGYCKIAEAVFDGYINGHKAGKYALAYALTAASDKTSQAYLDAKAVYENENATQEEIDAAFDSIKDTIDVPSNDESNLIGDTTVYAPLGNSVFLPVRMRDNTVSSLKVDGNDVEYTVSADAVVIKADAIEANGIYSIELKTSDGKTFNFVLHYGAKDGEIVIIDSDLVTYVNNNEWMLNPKTESGVAGFEGNCLHFDQVGGKGTVIGWHPDGAFEMIKFSFTPGATYNLSFDYKYGPNWNKGGATGFGPMWFGSGNGDVLYWYDSGDIVGAGLATAYEVTCIDEVNEIYHFTVTFVAPQKGNSLEFGGWNNYYDLYMDNIIMQKLS